MNTETSSSGSGIGAADPLLPQACAWIARLHAAGEHVLPYPVSRLQHRFRLGYSHAWALAEALERRGEWSIALDADGARHARLHHGRTA